MMTDTDSQDIVLYWLLLPMIAKVESRRRLSL